MHLQHRKTLLAALLCAAGFIHPCPAQVAPAAVLEMDVQNVVRYYEDTTDPTKFATVPGVVPAAVTSNFQTYVLIGDIVAINGQPVRGTVSHTARWTNLTPTPTPGQAIADMIRGGLGQWAFEIQSSGGDLPERAATDPRRPRGRSYGRFVWRRAFMSGQRCCVGRCESRRTEAAHRAYRGTCGSRARSASGRDRLSRRRQNAMAAYGLDLCADALSRVGKARSTADNAKRRHHRP